MSAITALRFTDPGCPWAYSFRPAHARLIWRFGEQIDWRLVMIGLTETAEEYVARGYTPAGRVCGQREFERRFSMPYIFPLKRIAGTSRACRAVVAAREVDPELGEAALRTLELTHFATTGLLDEDADLRAALSSITGLDADAIVASIDDPATVAAYEKDRALARSAEGSPTHVQQRHATTDGPVRYTAPSVVFEHRDGGQLEVGGFQPFEAYDTVLANLDPSLDRRPPPEDAADALRAFPGGLTTAEAASVLRQSDLDEVDIPAAEEQLTALAVESLAGCEPIGGDAIWRLREAGGGSLDAGPTGL